MKYIRNYNLYKESNSTKKTKVVTDLCISMLLINPNFLDNLLDKGLKGRYLTNNTVFVNDLRNLLFGNNRLRAGKFIDGKCVEEKELSKINQHFAYAEDFDIEKDWNKLNKSRQTARDIQDKLLLEEKLEPEMIKYVFWLGPNKEKGDKIDLVVELNNGIQYNIVLNSNLKLNRTKSFNTFADLLIGEENVEKLHSEEYQQKWNKLTQEWVRILYEGAKNNIKLYIERFVHPDRIYSITYNNYFDIKHSNEKFKHLGEHFPEFDKNILEFSDLMSEIYKNPEVSFENPEEVINEWQEKKVFILNSRIIEHLLTESFKSLMGEGNKLERENDMLVAEGDIKMNLVKTIVELIEAGDQELNYFYNSNYYKIPSREFFRDNYEDFKIKFDYHVNLTPSEDEEENNSQFDIVLDIEDEEMLRMNLSTKFSGGEMSGRLSTKIKFDLNDKFNYLVVKNQ